jgi:hypothetical protein
VLEHGRIVQRGRHDQLLAEDGLYRQIYDLQLRDQESSWRWRVIDERLAARGLSSGLR